MWAAKNDSHITGSGLMLNAPISFKVNVTNVEIIQYLYTTLPQNILICLEFQYY